MATRIRDSATKNYRDVSRSRTRDAIRVEGRIRWWDTRAAVKNAGSPFIWRASGVTVRELARQFGGRSSESAYRPPAV
jgi:hypothetical protein